MENHIVVLDNWCVSSTDISEIEIVRLKEIEKDLFSIEVFRMVESGEVDTRARGTKKTTLKNWEKLSQFISQKSSDRFLILPELIIKKRVMAEFKSVSGCKANDRVDLMGYPPRSYRLFEIASFDKELWPKRWEAICNTIESELEAEKVRNAKKVLPFLVFPEATISTSILKSCKKISWTQNNTFATLNVLQECGSEFRVVFPEYVLDARRDAINNFLNHGIVPGERTEEVP